MKKGLLLTGILCWLILAVPLWADTVEEPLDDISDGSRSVPVHLIPLVAEPMFEDEQPWPIAPDDEYVLPFSTRRTCSECHTGLHDYDSISAGWHFNALDANVPPGRPGQPWIFADPTVATQIPLSYRPWPGTFRPEQLGLSTWKFVQLFGGYTPGGGPGEVESDIPDEIMRSMVSGKMQINCLVCHNAHPAQDQAEYADQMARQNYRWAAAGACEFALVTGIASAQSNTYDHLMSDDIAVTYRKNTFDDKNFVFFDIVRQVPNERCYFCHSNIDVNEMVAEKWTADEDVHLSAGLTCVDCHRNGIGHNIVRGYEDEQVHSANPLAGHLSCKGCHLEQDSSPIPIAGRLGAPVPKHAGLPLVHFDRLSCTACHSGPWPGQETYRIKTSRAHRLGSHNVDKSAGVLPHIVYPVFAEQPDGKIGPHKLIWPAFWAALKDDQVTPIDILLVKKTITRTLRKALPKDSTDFPDLTDEYITKALTRLSRKSIDGKAVYICGGKLYQLNDNDQLTSAEHKSAAPYLWPVAHNVRPAVQSLGVRKCQDCHSTAEPFFFGKVSVDSPVVSERGLTKEMLEFQKLPALYTRAFAMSFVFRPMLKVVAIAATAVLAAVLLLYALKALSFVARFFVGKD